MEFKIRVKVPSNDIEKNINGKVNIITNITGEKYAVGELFGLPVPYTNPNTNQKVEDNTGTIKLNGDPSIYTPPKSLATEMINSLRNELITLYGISVILEFDSSSIDLNNLDSINKNSPIEKSIESNTDNKTGNQSAVQNIGNQSSQLINGIDNSTLLKGAAVLGGLAIAGGSSLISNSKDFFKKKGETESNSKSNIIGTSSPNITGGGNVTGPVTGGVGAIGPLTEAQSKEQSQPGNLLFVDQKKEPRGLQILVPSQYIDVYEVGKYGGEPALLTTKDSKQMVWYDKEYEKPEFYPSNLTSPEKVSESGDGDFKINLHLGYPGGKKVGDWSENGDQCFPTSDELKDFFSLCDKHVSLYGNKLTYTLATKADWDEATKNVAANKNNKPDGSTQSTPTGTQSATASTPSTGTQSTPTGTQSATQSTPPTSATQSATQSTPDKVDFGNKKLNELTDSEKAFYTLGISYYFAVSYINAQNGHHLNKKNIDEFRKYHLNFTKDQINSRFSDLIHLYNSNNSNFYQSSNNLTNLCKNVQNKGKKFDLSGLNQSTQNLSNRILNTFFKLNNTERNSFYNLGKSKLE
jgi:hypothetical protein